MSVVTAVAPQPTADGRQILLGRNQDIMVLMTPMTPEPWGRGAGV